MLHAHQKCKNGSPLLISAAQKSFTSLQLHESFLQGWRFALGFERFVFKNLHHADFTGMYVCKPQSAHQQRHVSAAEHVQQAHRNGTDTLNA